MLASSRLGHAPRRASCCWLCCSTGPPPLPSLLSADAEFFSEVYSLAQSENRRRRNQSTLCLRCRNETTDRFAGCCGALAMAQAPETSAWWDRPIAKNLNLSPEQQKQIQATVREYRDRLIEQRANVQKAEASLQDEMNEDQVNEARASEAIEKLVAARSEMTALGLADEPETAHSC